MINLPEKDFKLVIKILRKYFKGTIVFFYGSRITENIKPYSDIDIAVKGIEKFDLSAMNRAIEAFEESELNIRVDLLDYNSISEEFKMVIDRKHISFNL